MMPTSSGAHWGSGGKDVCPEAYPRLQVSPAPAGARFPRTTPWLPIPAELQLVVPGAPHL